MLTSQIKPVHLKFFCFAILCLSTLYLFGGLLTANQLYTQETPFLYFRIYEYYQEISRFGFPPELFPTAIQTGGFAFPMFYPPLSYLFTTLVFAIVRNVFFAVHFSLFLSVLFSAFSAFFSLTRFVGTIPAFIASVIYISFPYRFEEVLVRGDLAESWSFFWFPLVFASGMLLLDKKYSRGFLLLAIATAGLLTTHAVVGLYFMMIMALVFIPSCIIQKNFRAVFPTIIALAISLGLGAWYFLPAKAMWNGVKASDQSFMLATPEFAASQAPDMSQLFSSDPSRWNSFDIMGTYPGVEKDGMSFEMGFPYLVAACLVVLVFMCKTQGLFKNEIGNTVFLTLLILFPFLFLFMVYPSIFLKILPEQLSFIQFPWRFLSILAFVATAISALCLKRLELVSLPLVIGLILIVISAVNPIFKVATYARKPVEVNREQAIIWGNIGFVQLGEYLPKGYKDSDIGFLAGRVAKGENGVKILHNSDVLVGTAVALGREYEIDAVRPGTVVFPLLSYPVWKVLLDNKSVLKMGSTDGFCAVIVPTGQHRLTVVRIRAPFQVLGGIISMFSIVLLVLITLLFKKDVRLTNRRNAE
jgi:hypothetical protein